MLFKVMCEEYDREMVMDSVFFEVVDKINFEKLHCLDNDMVDLFKSARGGETRGVLEFVNQLGLLFSKKLDGEVGIVLDLFNEVFKKILFETGESLFMLNVIVKERKVNKKLDAFSLYMIIFCCTVDVFCVRHVDIYKVNRI